MKKNWYEARNEIAVFLAFEILIIFIVMGLFKIFSEPKQAGFVAGLFFVGLGVWIIARLKNYGRTKFISFYFAFVHLFGMSLPILLFRLKHFDVDFKDIHILGFTGPQFHQASTAIYLLMILATILDWLRCWKAQKTLSPKLQKN
jgi:hypothetical protein